MKCLFSHILISDVRPSNYVCYSVILMGTQIFIGISWIALFHILYRNKVSTHIEYHETASSYTTTSWTKIERETHILQLICKELWKNSKFS